MTDLTTKVFTKQREYERKLAAVAFIDPPYVMEVCGWMEPAQFTDPAIRKFWQGLKHGKSNIEAAEDAGLTSDLLDWTLDNTFTGYAQEYAEQISKYSYFAGISTELGKLANAVSNFDMEQARSLIDGMAVTFPRMGETPPNALTIAAEFIDMVVADDRSVKTGIPGLDNKTGGLERQTLSVVAGRPSMGKTAVALQVAQTAARVHKLKVDFFSLEMNRKSLWARMACPRAGVTWMDVRAKRISQEQEAKLLRESELLAVDLGENLQILDKRHTTNSIWQICAKERPDIVIVDHLRRVQDAGDNENKRQGLITERLSDMAKELDCHVLLCAQLNRGVENRGDHIPTLADLRDSGEIEENADQIFMMYRPDYYDSKLTKGDLSPTELWIRKFRDGVRDAQVLMNYNLKQQWFEPRYV